MDKFALPAKMIIMKTHQNIQMSWFDLDYNMNIYRGCNHRCIYCDSRSECYQNEDFENVYYKDKVLEKIELELRKKRHKGVVGTGSMSDPYNKLEESMLLTRNALKLINDNGFGVGIATKSSLVTRDIDLLKKISNHSPVIVKITITTFNDEKARIIEPYASNSTDRFNAIKELTDNGIYAGILLMPLLPFINDNEENIINIVRRAHEVGAKFIYPGFGVTLRDRQRDYLYKELDKSFPGISLKYRQKYGNNYSCSVPNAKRLYEVFKAECDRYHILYDIKDINKDFRKKYQIEQLTLF